ncbi:unnamed protein product [Amoebophrya sp. A25]|nr:unnamed protein product [Amoebophrya sp. A25]|eukprot:GSA25T00010939001.1
MQYPAALIVCDLGEDRLEDLREVLREAQYATVTHVDSTEKAAELVQRNFYDAVISKLGRERQPGLNGNALLQTVQRAHRGRCFFLVWSLSAQSDAAMRWNLALNGAHMVSFDMSAIRTALGRVASVRLSSMAATGTFAAVAGGNATSSSSANNALSSQADDPMTGPPESASTQSQQVHHVEPMAGKGVSATPSSSSTATIDTTTCIAVPTTPKSGTSTFPTMTAPLYSCPFCGLRDLTEDGLWRHMPLYHINARPSSVLVKHCPICRLPEVENMQVHIRNAHGPCRRGEVHSEFSERPPMLNAFALVVCIHRGKILLVQEFASSGFWLPGGRVDAGEDLKAAATRETLEEAGVAVEITGVLQVQYRVPRPGSVRLRVIFFARPILPSDPRHTRSRTSSGGNFVELLPIESIGLGSSSRQHSGEQQSASTGGVTDYVCPPNSTPAGSSTMNLQLGRDHHQLFHQNATSALTTTAGEQVVVQQGVAATSTAATGGGTTPTSASSQEVIPKTLPDYESAGAVWVALDKMDSLVYRGSEPLYWANYLRNKGTIFPVSVLSGKEN